MKTNQTFRPLIEFLSELRHLGIKLFADGERLRSRGPQGVLTVALREEISARKGEILAFLQHSQAPQKEPIRPRSVSQDHIPLSFAQQRLWFLEQLEGDAQEQSKKLYSRNEEEVPRAAYNEITAVLIHGALDLARVEQCLKEIVARHEILRTTFPMTAGVPRQEIAATPSLIFEIHEIKYQAPTGRGALNPKVPRGLVHSDLSNAFEIEKEVQRFAKQETVEPFNLATGPLLRVKVIRFTRHSHVLLVTMPHMIGDAWSANIFSQEFIAFYGSISALDPDALISVSEGTSKRPQGGPSGHSPPPLPIQYADYAIWERQWLDPKGEECGRLLAYWTKQLENAAPLLELPIDHPRPPRQSYRGSSHLVALPKALSEGLQALSLNKAGTTLFMTLLAAFKVLLMRYSGQQDIVVGTPTTNRNREGLELLIGLFVNTLALRTDLSGNPNFLDLLARVRDVMVGAYEHKDLPFGQLVEALPLERTLSYTPLIQVMFALRNIPQAPPALLTGLTLTPLELPAETAKFDLTLEMEERGDGLLARWKYNSDLFEPATIECMAAHWRRLLEAIIANPTQRIEELPLLTEAERYQLLVEWNDTQADYPTDKCIHQLFEEQVARTPDATAVVFEDQHLTYHELNSRANQLAHYLIKEGVGADGVVGLSVERSLEMVVGLLGILKAGAAYLPLDPSLPNERSAFMIEDAQVKLILTQQHLVETLPQGAPVADPIAQIICLDTDWASRIATPKSHNPSKTAPYNLAYIIFTSGSTGRPKGVAIEHRQLLNYVLGIQEALDLPTGASFATVSTLAADLGNTAIFPTLCTGGTLLVISQADLSDPVLFAKYAQKNTIEGLKITPSHLTALMSGSGPAGERLVTRGHFGDPAVLPRQLLVLGGEASKWELIEQIRELAPNCRIVNHYGPTETTIGVLTYAIRSGPNPKVPSRNDPRVSVGVPIGRPIANSQAYILDRHGQPVPPQVKGELYIGGAGVARGYLNRPQLTAEKFIANPFGPGKLYKTGDLCRYLPDGNIEFLGRMDHQVKIRGFRVELGEIEAVLSEHEAVREVMVIAVPHGGGPDAETTPSRLVAYVVCKQEIESGAATPSLREGTRAPQSAPPRNEGIPLGTLLRAYLKEKLPDYMVPTAFVQLDAFPLTANGKVNRRALPAPDESSRARATTFVAPRSETENILAAIWRELLRVEQVGIHDNFFELGGDSILSIQIISRARQAGLYLIPKQLFEHQTVTALAAVATRHANQGTLAEQGIVTGSLPLTPIQARFFEHPWVAPHHYNQSVLLSLSPEIEPAAICEVVDDLLRHHDALRLRFRHDGQRWEQSMVAPPKRTVHDPYPSHKHFAFVDLSALPKEEALSALERRANEVQASLNLSDGPLLRVVLFHLATGTPLAVGEAPEESTLGARLLIVIHHLAVDGVSWRILLEDIETMMEQKRRGGGWLPAKTTSFKTWAHLLNEKGVGMANELGYWQLSEAFVLPVDYRLGENSVASTAHVTSRLSISQTESLLSEVHAAYQTQINDLLLTALLFAFEGWTGNKTLLIDLEGHGREDLFEGVDLSRTVGWFTTVFPVSLHTNGALMPSGPNVPLVGLKLESQVLGAAIKSVKEQLREIPNRGIGYGILRYLSTRTKLGSGNKAEISFNYLGQFDQAVGDPAAPPSGASPSRSSHPLGAPSHIKMTTESAGETQSPKETRRYLLEILALVIERQLQITWRYSQNFYRDETICDLANSFMEALLALIAHCQEPEVGGYTPSDFSKVSLSQDELDELLAQFG